MASLGAQNTLSELEEGLGHLAGGRWDAAVVSLRVAAQREPGRVAVVRALATAYLKCRDDAGARAAVAGLTLNAPMCAEGWRLAAQLEWKLNRYDEAMEVLARGLEHLPNSQALHRQTALFWGARGKLEASARHAERVTTEDGPVAKYLAAAQGAEARAAGTMFEAATPAAAEGDGSDWFDRVAEDPKLLDSLLNLPGDEADLEMLKGLEFKLARLLESQPYHADRQLVLARLRVKVADLPAALLSVQRALRANPQYVEGHRLRATVLGKMGAHDEAIEILEGLIGRGMDWADLHYQVAELQAARGRSADARSHLYSAIRINPRFERAKDLLERVAA